MTANIGLIYLADTFNVLAAFTRDAEPSTVETAPDAFVRSGLQVRVPWDQSDPAFPTLGFVVSPANLKFAEFAANPAVLANSRNYYIDSTQNPAPYTLGALAAAQTGAKFAFSITPATPPTAASPYVLLVQPWAGGGTQLVTGTLIAGAPMTPVDLSSSYPAGSGKFHVLICVGGYGPTVLEISV